MILEISHNTLPLNWEFRKLRFVGKFQSSGIDKKIVDGEPLVNMINYTDIYGNTTHKLRLEREYMVVSCPEWKRISCQVNKGDLIFTPSSETKKDIGLSSVVDKDLPNTVFSYHVLRFVFTEEMDHEFKKYLCNNAFVLSQFSRLAQGTTRQILGREDFNSAIVILPPLEDQNAIANFLDHKTAHIDSLIQEKEKLLMLLEEKRNAIITNAVTKGLNPDVKTKPSSLEWLGDIPEHWEFRRMKYHVKINPKKSEIRNKDISVSFVPMESIGEYGGISLENEKYLEDVYDGYTYFRDNDIVVAKITPCFENGKGAKACNLLNGIAFGTTELHVLRCSISVLPDYLEYLTYSYPFRKWGEASMYGAGGQKRVPESFIKDFLIGIPPIDEQQEIIQYLHSSLDSIKVLKERIGAAIDKLKEYRVSLITSAVTGKIDVRDFKPGGKYEKVH